MHFLKLLKRTNCQISLGLGWDKTAIMDCKGSGIVMHVMQIVTKVMPQRTKMDTLGLGIERTKFLKLVLK